MAGRKNNFLHHRDRSSAAHFLHETTALPLFIHHHVGNADGVVGNFVRRGVLGFFTRGFNGLRPVLGIKRLFHFAALIHVILVSRRLETNSPRDETSRD
jgi:hypothetical protein